MHEYIQIFLLVTLIVLHALYWINKKNYFSSKSGIILDSCALIDGRIVELAKAGFVPKKLIIPKFIIRELQHLADGRDDHKRARARFGLDAIKYLQNIKYVDVVIDSSEFSHIEKIDDKLLALAKKTSCDLYTTDFNLNKVASIQNINVLNIHELAGAIRPNFLPGEDITVKVIQKGSSKGQGIGYMEDGSMIVIDGASKHVGKSVNVEVNKIHQTTAGKMLFGKIIK